MWKRSSVFLCIAALIVSMFAGAGTYAYTSGGSFTIDFSSPDTIKPVISGLSPGDTIYIVIKVPNPHYAPITAKVVLLNVVCDENGVVEPEQEWYTAHGGWEKNDIDSVITFGMWIDRDGDTSTCADGDKWIIDEAEGTHTVQVGTQTGSFTVTAPPPEVVPIWTRPGYVAGILIIIVIAAASVYALYRNGRLGRATNEASNV